MATKEKIKVSVLIPLYNSRDYIAATIMSILNQTFQDFELVLLNDKSADDTAEIIAGIKDPRIRYYENEQNLGISASRNKLIELSRGEYLAILDHDDISLPQRLEKQVAFLEANPDISAVGSATELFCGSREKGFAAALKRRFINLGWVWRQYPRPTLQTAVQGCPVMHPSSMIRRADLDKFGLRYNPEFSPAEDFGLWTDMLIHGLKLANLQEVLFKYNLHGNNLSLVKKADMDEADRKVKAKIKKYLNLPENYNYPYWKVMLHKLRWKYLMWR